MTTPTPPRKRTHPIAAAVALALLAGAVGDTFAADQRNKSPNAAAEAKHIERMQKARQQKEAQARPRALPKLQQVRPEAPKQRALLRQDLADLERMWKQQEKLFTPVLGARRGHGGMAPARSEASTRSVEIPAPQIDGANVMHQLHQANPYQYADRDADPAQHPNVEVPAPLSGSEAAYLLLGAAGRAGALTMQQIAMAKSGVKQLNFAQRNAGSLEEALQHMGLRFLVIDTGETDDRNQAIDEAIDAVDQGGVAALSLEPAIAFGELRGTERFSVVVVRMPDEDGSPRYRVIDPNRKSRHGEAAVGFYTLDTGEHGERLNQSIVDIDPAAVEDAYDGDVAYVIYGRK